MMAAKLSFQIILEFNPYSISSSAILKIISRVFRDWPIITLLINKLYLIALNQSAVMLEQPLPGPPSPRRTQHMETRLVFVLLLRCLAQNPMKYDQRNMIEMNTP